MESECEATRTRMENFKYYMSLLLGSVCILSIFAFLFLVPFFVDPALSTLEHSFVDEAVTCKVTSVELRHGKSNCAWSSCRAGCTADMYVCYQVRIMYSLQAFNDESRPSRLVSSWVDLRRFDPELNATRADTPLLVNIKGCGYPPNIDCAAFADKYITLLELAKTFPCHYSKNNPLIVLEKYHFGSTLAHILLSILVPNILFLAALTILLFWYCPYCRDRLSARKHRLHDDHNDNDYDNDYDQCNEDDMPQQQEKRQLATHALHSDNKSN